jgi:[glutamine synthetase] adenylyltransferase / [glutamine synthetase]-adenylyl-L-tyrosine phosphorylase
LSTPGAPIESRQPLDLSAAVAKVPFREPEAARQHLDHVIRQVSPGLAAAIPSLLAETPDPDSALICFDRLVSESGRELLRVLERSNFLAHYAIAVFGHSRYLAETLIQNPDLLPSFLREKNLDRSFSPEEFNEALARFRTKAFESDVSILLARFRRREYVRIMLRDVLKVAPLAETTAEISALSDVLIQDALREAHSSLQRKYGTPQHLDSEGRVVPTPFAILSLGKLGGNELNYSSDIDLLFLYGDGDEPAAASVSNREYFIRLAQQLTEILSRPTPEGPVFRIDLRLRPEGNQGELAVTLGYALRYYVETAHDWERQALIKLRHSAGDAFLARSFIRGVQPHVYTATVNFAAIKTALVSREKMHGRALANPASGLDVKLGRGGIRDIEFLVQCLQRVYGGSEPWLRSGGTLFSLQKLYDKEHLSGHEFHELTSAYVFLRHLEHRLQLRVGQQTHRLPTDPADLQVLTRSTRGFTPGEEPSSDLPSMVQRRMAAVSDIYRRIIYHQQSQRTQAASYEFRLRATVEPGASDSTEQILERLASDSPALLAIARRSDLTGHARRNLLRFLSSAITSSERYASVRSNPDALSRAIALFDSSEYLTEILVRHPEEIASLAEITETPGRQGGGYLFDGPFGRGPACGDPVFEYVATSAAPHPEKLMLLRRHYRHRLLVSGAQDITELRNVYHSVSVTTAAVEDAIAAAWAIAGHPNGTAILGLGRLGSGEFDLLSDADVLFVCEEGLDRVAITKSVEHFMHVLSAYTRDGMVCPVDARLRPHGAEGELLVTLKQLESYFAREAQPWEALMYTKLRFIAGSRSVGDRTRSLTANLFQRFAGDPQFRNSVEQMRARLDAADKNLKLAAGGVYDIDFLVSYLLIRHGARETGGSLRDRIWRCAASDLLNKSDAAVLDHAAELLRTTEHVVRLVVGRSLKWLPATEHARQVSERLTGKILGRTFAGGLEQELDATAAQVRSIYTRVLAGT